MELNDQRKEEKSYTSHHISLKSPQFFETDIASCFDILEVQFELAKITSSEKKFLNAISSLPPEVASKVSKSIRQKKDYNISKKGISRNL